METKTKFVAIKYASDGTCEHVLECKNLTKSEYNKLVNQANIHKDKELLEKSKILKDLDVLTKKAFIHDCILAKAMYDVNVERGFIELNEHFEDCFRDFILGKGEFPQELPLEYELILKTVKGE